MDEARLERITASLGSFFRVMRVMKGRSEASGIRPLPMDPQYLIIGLLRDRPRTMSELSGTLRRSKPNMTALVDRLISDGLVRRSPDKSDRRVVRIAITQKGRRIMEGRRRIAKEAIRNNLSPLRDDELDELCTSLENVNRIIAKLNSD